MQARRAKEIAMRSGDLEAHEAARKQVAQAKIALGSVESSPTLTG